MNDNEWDHDAGRYGPIGMFHISGSLEAWNGKNLKWSQAQSAHCQQCLKWYFRYLLLAKWKTDD